MPHIDDPGPRHLRDRAQLLFGRFRRYVHQHDAGLDPRDDTREGMPERIVDLPGEPVPLPGLGHSGGLIGIFLELFVRFLELFVQKDDALLLAHLRQDQDHHIEDKDEHVDQAQHIQNAEEGAQVVRPVIFPDILKGNRAQPFLQDVPAHEQVKDRYCQNIHCPLLPVDPVAHDIRQKEDDHTCVAEPCGIADPNGDHELQDQL